MAMPVTLDRYYTRAEVFALPEDGKRYELVHGELLVSPSPVMRHQLIVGRLHAWLFAYLERVGGGRVFSSPADLSWGLDDVTVQPDLFVTGADHVGETQWENLRHVPLVIECLSPSTARYDRFTKRRLYQVQRVAMYWIVDADHARVERWTPAATAPEYEERELEWQAPGGTEVLRIDLASLFAP
jgi:Uma2 family endonuclease